MINIHQLPTHSVKGIGTKKAEDLVSMGILTVADLLEHYPYRYEDYRLRSFQELQDGEKATVRVTVQGVPRVQRFGRNRTRMICKMSLDGHLISAVWFNQHFLKDKLQPSLTIVLNGKWDKKRNQLTVSKTEFSGQASRLANTLQPVYSLSGNLSQHWFQKVMSQALEQYADHIPEILPPELVEDRGRIGRKKAIRLLHHPENSHSGKAARQRIAYEELFLFQLKLQVHRAQNKRRPQGISRQMDHVTVRKMVRSLPFELTDAQKKVVLEIFRDMEAPYEMNRLLQGDVGSGKTIVAAIALYANYLDNKQGVLMVPTEILAEQHLQSLQQLFAPLGIEVELFTGKWSGRKRRDLLASLQMGLIDIAVGTHALIQEDVYFRSLGLVVTDEQHRFGVEQRALLRRKGMHPDVLSMTATPIPRTMAITAFGDMDISTLREMPKGRKPIESYWVKPQLIERVIRFIDKQCKAGHQAYVICPLIEESEKLDVQNAIDFHTQLVALLPDWKIGLLHGKVPVEEKKQIMEEFAANQVHVLVSTTVVEVGVNVPNATLMVILDADRFGMSQLHQLRGRVGRGDHQSYCIFIADPKNEIGQTRMKLMTETLDGFEIAQQDLQLRGPGDFFGTKQSGIPDFKVADLIHDVDLLEEARDDAAKIAYSDSFWIKSDYTALREYLYWEGILQGKGLET